MTDHKWFKKVNQMTQENSKLLNLTYAIETAINESLILNEDQQNRLLKINEDLKKKIVKSFGKVDYTQVKEIEE